MMTKAPQRRLRAQPHPPRLGGDGAGTVIDVDEKDFTIELSTMELTPGTYTFVATNNGQTTHALEIDGQGVEEETEDIAPGDTAELTVTLEAASTSSIARWATTGHGYEAGHHSRVGPRHRSMDDQAMDWALSGGALNPPVVRGSQAMTRLELDQPVSHSPSIGSGSVGVIVGRPMLSPSHRLLHQRPALGVLMADEQGCVAFVGLHLTADVRRGRFAIVAGDAHWRS